MNHDVIDDILATEETIVPSAGFPGAVMAAIGREASAPRKLTFPWLRALPVFLATLVAFGTAVWQGIANVLEPSVAANLQEQLQQLALLAEGADLHWMAIGLVITAFSLALATLLTTNITTHPRHRVVVAE